jgi:hypothetical protein
MQVDSTLCAMCSRQSSKVLPLCCSNNLMMNKKINYYCDITHASLVQVAVMNLGDHHRFTPDNLTQAMGLVPCAIQNM